jgi:hypothetical protein
VPDTSHCCRKSHHTALPSDQTTTVSRSTEGERRLSLTPATYPGDRKCGSVHHCCQITPPVLITSSHACAIAGCQRQRHQIETHVHICPPHVKRYPKAYGGPPASVLAVASRTENKRRALDNLGILLSHRAQLGSATVSCVHSLSPFPCCTIPYGGLVTIRVGCLVPSISTIRFPNKLRALCLEKVEK